MKTCIFAPIISVRIGKPQKMTGTTVDSAISKQEIHKPIYLSENGFEGDMQADKKHHGGPEKAIHFYAKANYKTWIQDGRVNHKLLKYGAFGENITLNSLEEKDIFIGDIFQLGKAVVQVSQNRQPCWKLNIRFNHQEMSSEVQNNGRTGWYCRVLQNGFVTSGDNLTLIERLQTTWSIKKLNHLMYLDPLNISFLQDVTQLDYLGKTCRLTLQKRLESGCVEDWTKRLFQTHQFKQSQ